MWRLFWRVDKVFQLLDSACCSDVASLVGLFCYHIAVTQRPEWKNVASSIRPKLYTSYELLCTKIRLFCLKKQNGKRFINRTKEGIVYSYEITRQLSDISVMYYKFLWKIKYKNLLLTQSVTFNNYSVSMRQCKLNGFWFGLYTTLVILQLFWGDIPAIAPGGILSEKGSMRKLTDNDWPE